MSRLIPNENTWLGFAATVASISAPTAANITASVNLTPFLISLNASSRGNTVPTPSLDTLFETSIPGTVQASFDADFYRDDDNDLAWDTLPRATEGYFIISRLKAGAPIAADVVEVWPVMVVSRTMANSTSNTALTFTLSCSVPQEPNEEAVVAA
jgi:hypothetical protein